MWRLASDAMVDVLTAALAAVSAVLLIRWRVNSAWRVLLGGVGNRRLPVPDLTTSDTRLAKPVARA
jgi:hypothetical protein